ncbi:MAG: hypothetical protein IPL94_04780 [Tetrasphaera sp.]|nr:hypothetical protein [Tetrasphaera sp.]
MTAKRLTEVGRAYVGGLVSGFVVFLATTWLSLRFCQGEGLSCLAWVGIGLMAGMAVGAVVTLVLALRSRLGWLPALATAAAVVTTGYGVIADRLILWVVVLALLAIAVAFADFTSRTREP